MLNSFDKKATVQQYTKLKYLLDPNGPQIDNSPISNISDNLNESDTLKLKEKLSNIDKSWKDLMEKVVVEAKAIPESSRGAEETKLQSRYVEEAVSGIIETLKQAKTIDDVEKLIPVLEQEIEKQKPHIINAAKHSVSVATLSSDIQNAKENPPLEKERAAAISSEINKSIEQIEALGEIKGFTSTPEILQNRISKMKEISKKIDKNEQKDVHLSKEDYAKLYVTIRNIGLNIGADVDSDIQKFREDVNSSLSKSRKMKGQVNKGATKIREKQPNEKMRVGNTAQNPDPLSQLQTLDKKNTNDKTSAVGDLADTLYKIDISSKKNKQQQEKPSEFKAKKETVGNNPPKSQIRTTIDKARKIISGVKDKIKPAAKDSSSPTTPRKSNKDTGRGNSLQ